MASVASQLIEEVTAHVQSDSLEDAREICADGTYFPNNLRNNCSYIERNSGIFEDFATLSRDEVCKLKMLHCSSTWNDRLIANKWPAIRSLRPVSTGLSEKSVLKYQTTLRHIPKSRYKRFSLREWKQNFGPEWCVFWFVQYPANPLNTKRRLLYLKTQFVPRSKHFSARL